MARESSLEDQLADDTNDLHFVPAPCQIACPVGTDAPSYIAYIWEGKYAEAFEAITATNPFSSICGRVCDAPCEPACRRTSADGTLQIRSLKRFVMDKLGGSHEPVPAPVSRDQSVAIVGAGPAGLVAAHDLAVAGFKVDVYEMTDRPGGMMCWGIPAFRLPVGIIEEDMDRLMKRCPGIDIHLNTALGRDVTLDELKHRHDAVLLTIGAWWGKSMGIPGEDDARIIDGVEFLRRVNAGARPEMPETVVVIGGGDVAMDACRVALRLPGCKSVKVIYRRGADEIPARRVELEGAIKEGVEFVYSTAQKSITANHAGLTLHCVRTEPGEADADGRHRPMEVAGSEHDIACGMIIAAVGQYADCADLHAGGLMAADRVTADFETMATGQAGVFAAGDGAFGGSTIVMAMHHGQRAAYYIRAYLEGREQPMAYRTPHRTRRVAVAQDQMWERLGIQEPDFLGLGERPVEFPEIEATYDAAEARNEAARCYRCDAETGSADYAVRHREDIFTMARTNAADHAAHALMLAKRMTLRDNPFPEDRPATLDDLVFLPANLSRLVIDPYREACKVSFDLGGRMALVRPFIASGFDQAPDDVRRGVARGLGDIECPYLGLRPIGDGVPWLQLVIAGQIEPSADAAALIHALGHEFTPVAAKRLHDDQLLGLAVSSPDILEEAIAHALDNDFDVLLIDASRRLGAPWAELSGPPDMTMMRDAIRILRRMGREEDVDLVYFGGLRSGTDAAKVIALGAMAAVFGVPLGIAAGGRIGDSHEMAFTADQAEEERAQGVANIIKASTGEASMMARCTGKTNLQNLEPEDLRSLTLATEEASGIILAGRR